MTTKLILIYDTLYTSYMCTYIQVLENMKVALRENLWQGRSGGLDVNNGLPINSDIIPSVIKKAGQQQGVGGVLSQRGSSSSGDRKPKKANNLPPLNSTTTNDNMNEVSYTIPYYTYDNCIYVRLSHTIFNTYILVCVCLYYYYILYSNILHRRCIAQNRRLIPFLIPEEAVRIMTLMVRKKLKLLVKHCIMISI